MNKCVVLVVTYNRVEMLKENIAAVLRQSCNHFDFMIVDNGSTDGTQDYVNLINDSRILYFNTGKNLGGAGGFSFGIKTAVERGYQYAWIMDDDSIPKESALLSLLNKAEKLKNRFSFMASLVYWKDGTLFDMNIPSYEYRKKMDLDFESLRRYKLLNISTSSFVGCLINLSIVEKAGLPIAEFFIYGDDLEYTSRLRKYGEAYLDLDSVIVHKAPSNMGADVVSADETRIHRFYYQARNGMYIAKKNKKILYRMRVVLGRLRNVLLNSESRKWRRIIVTVKGTVAGLFFEPEIQYPKK